MIAYCFGWLCIDGELLLLEILRARVSQAGPLQVRHDRTCLERELHLEDVVSRWVGCVEKAVR